MNTTEMFWIAISVAVISALYSLWLISQLSRANKTVMGGVQTSHELNEIILTTIITLRTSSAKEDVEMSNDIEEAWREVMSIPGDSYSIVDNYLESAKDIFGDIPSKAKTD